MFSPDELSRWSRWAGRLLCTCKIDKVPTRTFFIEIKYKSTYVHTCLKNNTQAALLEHEIVVKASNIIILPHKEKMKNWIYNKINKNDKKNAQECKLNDFEFSDFSIFVIMKSFKKHPNMLIPNRNP